MRDFEQELQVRLAAFVREIEALLRDAVVDALEAAVGVHAAAPIGRSLGRGRSRVTTTRAVAATKPSRARRAGQKPGGKRSAQVLADLTEVLDAHIRKNKGLGIEAIGRALGTSTKELALPVKKLLSERRIAARGVKRATRYFPR